jgi:hypothetical protein
MSAEEWDYPFSQEQVAAWKKEYGQNNVHLVEGFDEELFVVRGFGRKEFKALAGGDFRNEDDLEDQFVERAILFPSLTITKIREKEGGFSSQLFEKIMQVSNVDANRQVVPLELPSEAKELKELDPAASDIFKTSKITSQDIGQWKTNWRKLYYEVLEDKIFVYHGLRRKDYEKFREGQRNGEHYGPASEEALVESGVLYPFKMEGDTDEYLHGTISHLSNLIYAASGFGSTTTVQKL